MEIRAIIEKIRFQRFILKQELTEHRNGICIFSEFFTNFFILRFARVKFCD